MEARRSTVAAVRGWARQLGVATVAKLLEFERAEEHLAAAYAIRRKTGDERGRREFARGSTGIWSVSSRCAMA